MKKHTILAIALASVPLALSASTPLWMRDIKISPDGNTIAFTYKGDIWTVPAAGGKATRITTADSYETSPVWSPDGKKIAFSSDRHGSLDIFICDVNGGNTQRLTSNSATEVPETFTPDGKNIVFSAAIQAPASSAVFPTSRMTQLYTVPVAGGVSTQIMATPAQMLSYTGDNGSFLYQDLKGFEDEWRKHHTSSVTRDIWLYDAKKKTHTNLTNRPGEDRNPVVAGDKFYFLSERTPDKSINVYEASIANPADARKLTSFKTHPVRFLSRGANGLLCFGYDGEIYTMTPGQSPKKVAVDIVADYDEPVDKLALRSASSAIPSPDGKSVAFISRGDVFVTSVEYTTTKQITNTPEAESMVSWSPDGKSLVYASERDGIYNIYKAELARPDEELRFENSTSIKETPMFKPDGHERNAPDFSPDGKKLAFIKDRTQLWIMDVKNKSVRQLTDGRTNPERNGSFNYQWSPDSKWIVIEGIDRKHEPYYDVILVNVATGQTTNLTNSGYFDESPRWVLDGNAILFLSERYGMRNHASWGSQSDVMLAFLNRDAYDRFRLSEEDYAIQKELDKKAKKKDDDKKDDNRKDKDEEASSSDKDVEIEYDGIEDRIVRLTPMSAQISDAIISGDNLYYIMSANNGTQLWKLNLRKGDHKMVQKVDGARYFAPDKKGDNIFILGSSMRKLAPKSDKITSISFSGTHRIDHAAEREAMFDKMTREERQRFYTPGMHGVDWDTMTKSYRRFLPHINNNYDYAEMLSELLGELNVSHTGGRYYRNSQSNDERTATLGLLYDMHYNGEGLKVDEVLAKGPFGKASSEIVPGSIVTAVNGNSIDRKADYTAIFSDIAGKKTLVSFKTPDGKQHEEVVVPISTSRQNALLYDRWVKQRAAYVDSLSNGRLGYVHIQSMADDSFRKMYADALGKYNDREGLVVDIRWNGGGRLHEDVEVFLTGQKYLTQEIRGVQTCDMPSRRWNKPSVMVMCEACYSNAHGTPWVYKHQNIGKLVGMPVPGTMTSVNWVTMQDPSLVYGIPVIGYRTAEGGFLENSQLEPDIRVENTPETIVKGVDLQLKAAVESLLKDIDSKK